MITITIANRKGGIGKTTTAQALAEGLKEKCFKVLSIDMDGQANLTANTRHEGNKHHIADILKGSFSAKKAIEDDFIASDDDTDYLENQAELKPDTLKRCLRSVKPTYDYCIIDTPPKLSQITLIALYASDEAIITATPEQQGLSGIGRLFDAIEEVKEQTKALKALGILFVRNNPRRILYQQAIEGTKKAGYPVYDATIRESISIMEAQALREPIFRYCKGKKVLDDYRAFVDETIAMERKEK